MALIKIELYKSPNPSLYAFYIGQIAAILPSMSLYIAPILESEKKELIERMELTYLSTVWRNYEATAPLDIFKLLQSPDPESRSL